MIHPIPPGTRDVLPDEMRELRRLHLALIEVFESRGYGEVATPAIEYDEVLARGDGRTADSAYRFFDERGDLLALRSDMTVPIARLVASRYAERRAAAAALLPRQRLPRRAPAARPDARVRPGRGRADRRPGAGGDGRGGRGAGGGARRRGARPGRDRPRRRRPLPPAARPSSGSRARRATAVLGRLAAHDLVGLEVELSELDGIGDEQVATCVALSQLRGGREVLDEARALGGAAVERATARLGETFEALEARGVADRVQIDLGLLRDLGYYSGAILEVYDPALGHVLGGGGRYDGLLKRFGVDLPAAGFALYLERVHVAQMEEESRAGVAAS